LLAGAFLSISGCTFPVGDGAGSATIPRLYEGVAEPLSGTPIRHVIVVIQENRTVDNFFNGFPNADTVLQGENERGEAVTLQPTSLTAPYDLGHRHGSWRLDYARGKMFGFSSESIDCYAHVHRQCPRSYVAAYGYVPKSQIQPYWDMAEQYTFADEMFQTNQGPSFPAHQYLVSGTSTIANDSPYKASDNPDDVRGRRRQGGCDSVLGARVPTIDPAGNAGPSVFPCFHRISIMQLMDRQDVSWRYYQEYGGSGQWHAVDAIENIWHSPSYSNVEWPSSRVLKDIGRGELADVSFVTPDAKDSDHAGRNNGSGPSWVASIVNAVGKSSYWDSTAIVVTWDDWGGWYDHVPPKVFNSYELGFRVPMIVISPYAKTHYVSHVAYEFGSILKFIEETFGLPSLKTTDRRSTDLSDCFDFRRPARAFAAIPAKYSIDYFERQPIDYESPDDDR
jgi:phospholipase C